MASYQFILASGNQHKAQEFNELFDTELVKVESAKEKLEVVEDGATYFENALLKAQAYYNKYKTPVLADDSGLTVYALIGELGIHSARFGGAGLSDRDRAYLLLEKMQNIRPGVDRDAYFTCVLCFYFSALEYFFFEGRMSGTISMSYDAGDAGFGYDPVFIPEARAEEGLSISRLGDWKNSHSHRAQAVKLAQNFFKSKL